ncbi:MAG: DUF6621 family protein [Prevotella sp.]|nr:DUF6621 family protein [Prevotella sp.]MEE0337378.1 DUF6621 family protein [Prevotella sp.]
MNNNTLTKANWSENVIIVDADYVDRVAFDLIVNFERMIGRRIHKADLAKWIDCVALDGGLREGEHDTQVVLIHDKKQAALDNFVPANYDDELNGKAFKDHLGEFTVSSFPVEDITTATDFFLDTVAMVCAQKEVKRVMIIPDAENRALYADLRHTLQRVDDEKRITVFAMQPMEGGNFRQEILGYSLMNALGIRAEELK